jgi:hypothetical protein
MDIALLKASIEQQERIALGYLSGELSQARADSLSAYFSEPLGNEQEGRSAVVTSDVSDVVEGVLPGLVRVFTSGDEICVFEPVSAEDEQAAKQETDVVNYFLSQSNNFLPFIQTWLRDGLISKNGYAKVIWEDDEIQDIETYQGLDENEVAYMMQIPELELEEQSQDEYGAWTLKFRKTTRKGKPKLYNCPPESILINPDHTEVSLRNAKFVQHRTKMTISDVREMGYKIDDDIGDSYEADYGSEFTIRNQYEDATWNHEVANDPASRVITFKETWMRVDFNNDKHTELRRICMVGSTVLANEETDTIPVCAWTPLILPHRHVGRSLAEMVEDIQETKTALLRTGLDSLFLSIHGRWAVSDKVELDDMLVSRPGGVVRLNDGAMPGEGHIMPLIPPALAGQAFPALEYMDSVRETRTGITRYNQGMDANSLNKTASGIQAIMSAAQARIELIARNMAETGMRDLVMLMHELIRKHSDKEMVIRLRNEWVPVDPRIWKTRYDMTISVGLGTGNREQQMANMLQVMNVQKEAFQTGIVTPENIYNSASKLAELAGFKAPELFFTNKDPNAPPPLPPEVQQQMQQVQQHIQQLTEENQKLQQEIAKRDADTSVEVYKVDKQAETDIMKTQMQNESKEMIMSVQTIADALMQSQQDLATKVQEVDNKEIDLSPIMEAMKALQDQIAGTQPVGIKQIRDESGRLVGGVRVLADGSEQEISIQ